MEQPVEAYAAPLAVTPSRRRMPQGMPLAWLGVAPFFLFCLLFLILPTLFLIGGAFQDADGHFTLQNLRDLFAPNIISAYWISIEISAASAIAGAILGALLAGAVVLNGLPGWLRPTLMTFCGVASNFAGLPLAFAFLATLGRTGLVTIIMMNVFGFNLYPPRVDILRFLGPDA